MNRTSFTPDGGELPDSPPLVRDAIGRGLADAALSETVEIEVVATTGSTNEDLLAGCRRRRPAATRLRAADEQTAGRGRQRRSWLARPRSALLFSLAIPLPSSPPNLPAVTLACGVALADQLIARGVAVQVKWPNDLLFCGRKLAGVLCELAVDADARVSLVVGVGVNVWLTEADRKHIDQPAAALSDAVPSSLLVGQRERWIAAFAAAILLAVRRFERDGFVFWRARYNELLAGRGELVDIIDDGRIAASGRISEVDALGRLMLTGSAGLRAISVGDVSLRLPAQGIA